MTTTTTAVPLVPGLWELDGGHASASFSIRQLGVVKVRGRFDDIAAQLTVGTTAADCSVEATVALASIDTANTKRDTHLRSADLLDVENRPTMSFRSTSARGEGSHWTLDGDLTIGDTTRPLTLDVEFDGVGRVGGMRHAGFEARGEIRRKDFGLGFGALGAILGNRVKIELDVRFIEPTPT